MTRLLILLWKSLCSSEQQVIRDLEHMMDVIRSAHKSGVVVRALHHQFNWKGFFFPTSPGLKSYVQSVKGIKSNWRSFEVSMDKTKQVVLAGPGLTLCIGRVFV